MESPGKDPLPHTDYMKRKSKTMAEFFPLPNIEEVVEKVFVTPFIIIMVLTKRYCQIPFTEWANGYTAFVMPFGTFI